MRVNDIRGFDFGLGETADMRRESVRGSAADKIAPRADEIDRSNIFPAERAAHDALQTRDRAKLPHWAGRSLGWPRISGAPLRAHVLCWMMYQLCMHSRCAASGTHSRPRVAS